MSKQSEQFFKKTRIFSVFTIIWITILFLSKFYQQIASFNFGLQNLINQPYHLVNQPFYLIKNLAIYLPVIFLNIFILKNNYNHFLLLFAFAFSLVGLINQNFNFFMDIALRFQHYTTKLQFIVFIQYIFVLITLIITIYQFIIYIIYSKKTAN